MLSNLIDGVWSNVTGQIDITGSGAELTLTDPAPTRFPCYYRVQVSYTLSEAEWVEIP